MRSRIVAMTLFGVLALAPSAVAAQEPPPERLPTDQQMVLPEDKPEAVGACGSDASALVDRQPLATGLANPENANKGIGGETRADLTAVRGTILHAEGNLVLVKLPEAPSLGNTTPAGQPRPNLLAVVRLPAECAPGTLTEGEGVIAVGRASTDGILNAESVQPAAQ